ncbi:glycerate kinase [Marivita sp. S0852]|uniref:glycerate kinase type-2 family protein n=1 Tax=Marivita sp. S0852 TaxID=3373893 RepID=UPI0039820867
MQTDKYASLKSDAARAFRAAVRRADPALAMRDCLETHPLPQPDHGCKTIVLAFGKAAPAMLGAVLGRISGRRVLICVTHRENSEQVPGAEMFRAGHPVPDSVGASGAQRMQEVLNDAVAGDVVIALISGGGSALLPAPPEGVSLEDKQLLNRLLLQSGLDIEAMNLVRQQVSNLKGGGMTRLAAPAKVTSYILSDVIGDDLRAIASGPTVAPLGTAETARRCLQDKGLFERLPESIQLHLRRSARPHPPVTATHHLIGTNAQSVLAASADLEDRYAVQTDPQPLTGNVNAAANTVFSTLQNAPRTGGPRAFLWGGETTVQVRGTGVGGRNQELALRVAALADAAPVDLPWVFLSAGTDGRDGPTDAAGAIVDQHTLARIRSDGQSPMAYLDRNDSNAALRISGDLLVTGATGTNVADVQILLIGD